MEKERVKWADVWISKEKKLGNYWGLQKIFFLICGETLKADSRGLKMEWDSAVGKILLEAAKILSQGEQQGVCFSEPSRGRQVEKRGPFWCWLSPRHLYCAGEKETVFLALLAQNSFFRPLKSRGYRLGGRSWLLWDKNRSRSEGGRKLLLKCRPDEDYVYK